MGMETVVFVPEPFGLHIDLLYIPEQMSVQYVLAIGPVEPFDESVLARLARLYILYLDILDLAIVHEDPRKELGPVVDPDGQWLAMDLYGLPEIFHHPYPGHRKIPFHAKSLAVEVVHKVEYPEVPAGYQAVGHEVCAPDLPWRVGHLQGLLYPLRQPFLGLSP